MHKWGRSRLLKKIVAKLDITSYLVVFVNHPYSPIKRNKYSKGTYITIHTILKQANKRFRDGMDNA